MKKRYVCKKRIKNGILLMISEFIFGLVLMIFMIFSNETNNYLMPIAVSTFIAFGMIIITFIYMIQYLGKIYINDNVVTLTLLNKKYTFFLDQVVIIYINYEMTPRFSGHKIYSIKIRIKGEKNIIPIKIIDEDVVKYLFENLNFRREPQDFKFEWELQKNEHKKL